jgi:FAD dependent oxidoreductase TIGR03364
MTLRASKPRAHAVIWTLFAAEGNEDAKFLRWRPLLQFDVAIVGAGIVGLAHALAAARQGFRTLVIERDERAVGASIRNFGFITVTGQQSGECWRRAMRSRDVWDEVAPQAGIPVVQEGLIIVGRRQETVPVLEAFRQTEMGEACVMLTPDAARRANPALTGQIAAAMYSPHERRVESRDAIPRLAAWLERAHRVTFLRNTAVRRVETGRLETAAGMINAKYIVACPGDDLATLFPERMAHFGVGRAKLQMLRLTPRRPITLDAAVMTDLSLIRYLGYAELPEAAPLRARLRAEQAEHVAAGVHLIAVQSADGTLVVGDTHVYGHTLDPFSNALFDELVLDEFSAVFSGLAYDVSERWIGTYASLDDRLVLIDTPLPDVRLVVVTSGTGASTAFAIGEETIRELTA